MKMRMTLLAMTALALVSACSRGAPAGNAAAGNSTTNAATPANATAPANASNASADAGDAAESGGAVDVAFLTGRWGIAGDCAMTIEFRADGTVTPPDGSTYTISGNVVTVTTPGQPPDPGTVTRTGDDAMTVVSRGSSMNYTRCR